MSTLFDDERFTWRETFFILLEPQQRPRQDDVQALLRTVPGRVRLLDASPASGVLLGTMTVMSLDDHSAVEIRYSQDPAIAEEMKSLAKTFLDTATHKEVALLKKAIHLPAKIEMQHFEQTAGSGMFILDTTSYLKQAADETKKDRQAKSRFHFDPDSYENCHFPGKNRQPAEADDIMDSERINPGMLLYLLEKIKHLTHGIAIDPASGMIW